MDTEKLKADLEQNFIDLCNSRGVKWERTEDKIKVNDVLFRFEVTPIWNQYHHEYDQFRYVAYVQIGEQIYSYLGQIMDIDWKGDMIPVPRQHDFVHRFVADIESKSVFGERNETLVKLS